MNSDIYCVFCGASTIEQPAAESAKVRCDIREFGTETFTVWRCAECGSLHALEPIDADRYYRNYPVKSQYDIFVRAQLQKRMQILKSAGLHRGNTLLDYGCGSGHFVRYAREHGIRAEGYDPYSEECGDAAVLDRRYDFVTAQDVLEHVDDPRALVDDLRSYAASGGSIAIGTPNADAIDLHNPLDQIGLLHQPYHRHIPSVAELQRIVSDGSWRVIEFRKEWYGDTRVPFVNLAFLMRLGKSAGGFNDVSADPISSILNHILAHPSLIFWGLFGSFFSRENEMLVIARAPAEP